VGRDDGVVVVLVASWAVVVCLVGRSTPHSILRLLTRTPRITTRPHIPTPSRVLFKASYPGIVKLYPQSQFDSDLDLVLISVFFIILLGSCLMADSNNVSPSLGPSSSRINRDSLLSVEYKPMNYIEKVKRWSTDSSDRDFTAPVHSAASSATMDTATDHTARRRLDAPPVVGGRPNSSMSLSRPLSQELYTTGFNVDIPLDQEGGCSGSCMHWYGCNHHYLTLMLPSF
jgi:hypothetical protein